MRLWPQAQRPQTLGHLRRLRPGLFFHDGFPQPLRTLSSRGPGGAAPSVTPGRCPIPRPLGSPSAAQTLRCQGWTPGLAWGPTLKVVSLVAVKPTFWM